MSIEHELSELKRQVAAERYAVYDLVQDLIQADSEHGAQWLNELASKEFCAKYPQHVEIINKLARLSADWGPA
jgi:hypothetical protein